MKSKYVRKLGLSWLLSNLLLVAGYAWSNPLIENSVLIPELGSYFNPVESTHQPQHLLSADAQLAQTNDYLAETAANIRDNTMSIEQRMLNHQWLNEGSDADNYQLGSRVISHIVKLGFKTYWKEHVRPDQQQATTRLPSAEGDGQFNNDFAYKIRMSGDELRLSLQYGF